jgi:hypothetical protein
MIKRMKMGVTKTMANNSNDKRNNVDEVVEENL